MNNQDKIMHIRTEVKRKHVLEFDGVARSNGLSRFKLMALAVKWIGTGLVDVSQLIKVEQEKEQNSD